MLSLNISFYVKKYFTYADNCVEQSKNQNFRDFPLELSGKAIWKGTNWYPACCMFYILNKLKKHWTLIFSSFWVKNTDLLKRPVHYQKAQ